MSEPGLVGELNDEHRQPGSSPSDSSTFTTRRLRPAPWGIMSPGFPVWADEGDDIQVDVDRAAVFAFLVGLDRCPRRRPSSASTRRSRLVSGSGSCPGRG
jgi:hypothetical protein